MSTILLDLVVFLPVIALIILGIVSFVYVEANVVHGIPHLFRRHF